MQTQTIRIPIKAWYGDEEMELQFPETWEVHECRMAGHDAPPLSEEQLREALRHPVGTEPLREMARGKKQVVILFDDLTRPAPTWKILPYVLEELQEAGITDDQIRFIGAFANHAAMCLEDFVKKLGKDVVRRFRIYNHNPYEHLVDLGKTTRGTPVLINREVMECDLKIGIGGLIPHLGAGFGGGAKLVVPGVAGIVSADHNHRVIGSMGGDRSVEKKFRLGKIEDNEVRQDIEEAVRKVGLDLKIDLLVNNRREIVGVFAGDFIAQHRAGVEKAKQLYATQVVKDCDIVVTNAFPIENQVIKGVWPARLSLKAGGTAVVVVQSVEGQALHYLAGRFGTNYGGNMWGKPQQLLVPQAGRLLVCSSYLSRTDLDMYGPAEKVIPCSTWAEVLIHLLQDHPQQAKVAVYPYAAIQYPAAD
ncbi:MAG: nickel-dependent lactate racemase [Nitrospinota bacterium]|nr:MAG: nickel-dependent lactate racemase [Nitrospinota bacterium]